MFGPKGPFCQSCGMPLSRDALGGGTNADGSRSTEYCSHCYRSGHFTEPNISLEEMMTKVEGKLREMRLPGFRQGDSPATSRSWPVGSGLRPVRLADDR